MSQAPSLTQPDGLSVHQKSAHPGSPPVQQTTPGPPAVRPPCLDGAPCEMVRRLLTALHREAERAGHLDGAEKLLAALSDLLPCDRCQGAESAVASLGRLRLGRREREILLIAPPPTAEAYLLVPRGTGRAAADVQRRALKKLVAANLIRVSPSRTVQRRPLGQAVVERLGPVLKRGGRIRWAEHRAALLEAVRQPPAALLSEFRAALLRREAGLLQKARFWAAIGRQQEPPTSTNQIIAVEVALRAVEGALSAAAATVRSA